VYEQFADKYRIPINCTSSRHRQPSILFGVSPTKQSGEERGRGSDHVIGGEDVDFSDLDPGQPRRFFLTSTFVAYTIFGSFRPVRVRGDRTKIKRAEVPRIADPFWRLVLRASSRSSTTTIVRLLRRLGGMWLGQGQVLRMTCEFLVRIERIQRF
jgi:hypothetical protein